MGRSIFLMIITQAAFSQIAAKDTGVINAPPVESKSFAVTNATAVDVVKKLRNDGIRICFEQNRATPGAVVSFVEDASATTNLIQKVVSRLNGYRWHNPNGSDIFVIFPSESSALSWNVSALDAKNRPFWDVVVSNDLLDLKRHDVIVFYRGFVQPLNFNVNVQFRNKPVIECLNELIVDQPGLCWTLVTNPRGKKVLTFQYLELHP